MVTGTGKELYSPFPSNNFTSKYISRGGKCNEEFYVPAGKDVVVDAYTTEGRVDITISSVSCSFLMSNLTAKGEGSSSSSSRNNISTSTSISSCSYDAALKNKGVVVEHLPITRKFRGIKRGYISILVMSY